MNHVSIDELNELIDGRLPESRRESLRTHLEECSVCASTYRQYRIIDRGARNQTIEKTSAVFVDRLMKKIVPGIADESRIERVIKYSANFFAVIVVAFLIYGIVFLVTRFAPGDSSLLAGMKAIPELSAIYDGISNGWNSLITTINRPVTSINPQGKFPLWLYGIWSMIIVAIIDKVSGKRLRRISQIR